MPGLLLLLTSGAPVPLHAQFATSDRVSQPEFWPTQTRYSRDLYVGAESCGGCHNDIFKSAQLTPMAHAAMRASESSLLQSNRNLTFSHDRYRYDIRTESGASIYSVMDGNTRETAMLEWAFGSDLAQSWLFKRKDGELYEARVTYFQSLNELSFTPGRALGHVSDPDEAMDRQVGRAEVYRCFGCHTTASGMGSTFDESKLVPGVKCEACHGPGLEHVDSMQGMSDAIGVRGPEMNTEDAIFNPRRLTPEESVDFCGACHGSYWDVSLMRDAGSVDRVRFEPYRLEQSKCWNKSDARLTCIACHDPHKQLDTVTTDYDHVCLGCHLNGNKLSAVAMTQMKATHPGPACPVARENCVSCHMPEVYVPAMHRGFPDHRIRIARDGEPFPD